MDELLAALLRAVDQDLVADVDIVVATAAGDYRGRLIPQEAWAKAHYAPVFRDHATHEALEAAVMQAVAATEPPAEIAPAAQHQVEGGVALHLQEAGGLTWRIPLPAVSAWRIIGPDEPESREFIEE